MNFKDCEYRYTEKDDDTLYCRNKDYEKDNRCDNCGLFDDGE